MTRQGFMSLLPAKVNEHSPTLQGEIARKYFRIISCFLSMLIIVFVLLLSVQSNWFNFDKWYTFQREGGIVFN